MPTVLVVDDEAPIREFIARTASNAGWTATEAPDAESALEILNRSHVDLICLDVRLPMHDGIWVADAVYEQHPDTAVLFLTGMDVLPGVKTLRRGVVGYLVKPFQAQDLLAILGGLYDPAQEPPPPPPSRLRRVK